MKKKRNVLLLTGGGLILLIGLLSVILQGAFSSVTVKTTPFAVRQVEEKLLTSGKIESVGAQYVFHQPQAGELKKIYVKEGEKVKEGTPLLKYAYKKITSQASGVVLQVNPKAVIPSSTSPLVTIADPSKRHIKTDVSEYDALKVQKEQLVRIFADSLPRQQWCGKVSHVATLPTNPIASEENHSSQESDVRYAVTIDIPSPPPLKLGSRVMLELVLSSERLYAVPLSAIKQEKEQMYVYVVKDGKAERKNVKVGKRGDRYIQILSGLQPNEKVIVHPPAQITDGTDVTIQ